MNEKTNKKGFGAWFRDNWKNNALFSTGIALIVMVILQTLALGFDYASNALHPCAGRFAAV